MHGVPALTWVEDLANDAQEYAKKLARAHTLRHASKSERKEAGENLAFSQEVSIRLGRRQPLCGE